MSVTNRALFGALFFVFFLFSCNKDVEFEETNIGSSSTEISLAQNLISLENLSFQGLQFFKLDRPEIQLRNKADNLSDKTKKIYHPFLIESYKEIADQNARNNFVDGILENVGYPLWDQSFIYTNRKDQFHFAAIPLIQPLNKKVSGVIIIKKENSKDFVIDAMSKDKILNDANRGNLTLDETARNFSYLNFIMRLERQIFGETDSETFRVYEESLPIVENFIPTPTSGENSCRYEYVEICFDLTYGFSWLGGFEVLPLDIDHDQDGIVNSEDQDFWDWSARHGDIPPDEFSDIVREFYHENFSDEYGDYDDFYDDITFNFNFDWDFNLNLGGLFEFIWDALFFLPEAGGGAWNSFWNLFFEEEVECPTWCLQEESPQIETRSVNCDWFYIWSCPTGHNWWEIDGAWDIGEVHRQRLTNYFIVHELDGQIEFSYLESYLLDKCGRWDIDYEECVAKEYRELRISRIRNAIYLSEFGQTNIDPEELYDLTLHCKITSDSSDDSDFNNCVGELLSQFHEKIMNYISNVNPQLTFNDAVGYISASCLNAADFNTCATESIAIRLHQELNIEHLDYRNANVSLGYYNSNYSLQKYIELANIYKEYKYDSQNGEPEIVPVVYLVKKLAEAGVGALTDLGIQLVMEYWMGDHSSFVEAWNQLDINEWQVFSSGLEAIWKNKYASTVTSAFSDGMTYVVNVDEGEFNWESFGASIGLGAVSGFIGSNAADYVGGMAKYFIKYGPAKPTKKLVDLGIHSFFFKFGDFRALFIKHLWLDNCKICRGNLLEGIQNYGRYADNSIVWVNKIKELNGPLDFIDLINNTGIQLKTIANANDWISFKSKVKKGLNQLNTAISNGDVTSGRLDIMMPDELNGNFSDWTERIYSDFINNPNFPEYSDLEIIIGSFIE